MCVFFCRWRLSICLGYYFHFLPDTQSIQSYIRNIKAGTHSSLTCSMASCLHLVSKRMAGTLHCLRIQTHCLQILNILILSGFLLFCSVTSLLVQLACQVTSQLHVSLVNILNEIGMLFNPELASLTTRSEV